MNNTFSLKRFGAYLAYDIRNLKNNYLLSLILLGVSPLLIYVVCQLVHFVFAGSFGSHMAFCAPIAAFIAILVTVVTFPTKQYGSITDKRAGSSWLMLPASTLEKTLSLIVVTCVVLPLALGVVFLDTDGLLSLLFPESYGNCIFQNLRSFNTELQSITDSKVYINIRSICFLDWCESILIFTLGAIVFKKSKAAKTILALTAFGLIMGNLAIMLLAGSNVDIEAFFESNIYDEASADIFMTKMNVVTNVLCAVTFGALIGGIYYRLKTIQH